MKEDKERKANQRYIEKKIERNGIPRLRYPCSTCRDSSYCPDSWDKYIVENGCPHFK